MIKAIQLYEMIVVRHGLMLVGQSYGMKTSVYRTLAAALTGELSAGVSDRLVHLRVLLGRHSAAADGISGQLA
jgi:dynein heavy chain